MKLAEITNLKKQTLIVVFCYILVVLYSFNVQAEVMSCKSILSTPESPMVFNSSLDEAQNTVHIWDYFTSSSLTSPAQLMKQIIEGRGPDFLKQTLKGTSFTGRDRRSQFYMPLAPVDKIMTTFSRYYKSDIAFLQAIEDFSEIMMSTKGTNLLASREFLHGFLQRPAAFTLWLKRLPDGTDLSEIDLTIFADKLDLSQLVTIINVINRKKHTLSLYFRKNTSLTVDEQPALFSDETSVKISKLINELKFIGISPLLNPNQFLALSLFFSKVKQQKEMFDKALEIAKRDKDSNRSDLTGLLKTITNWTLWNNTDRILLYIHVKTHLKRRRSFVRTTSTEYFQSRYPPSYRRVQALFEAIDWENYKINRKEYLRISHLSSSFQSPEESYQRSQEVLSSLSDSQIRFMALSIEMIDIFDAGAFMNQKLSDDDLRLLASNHSFYRNYTELVRMRDHKNLEFYIYDRNWIRIPRVRINPELLKQHDTIFRSLVDASTKINFTEKALLLKMSWIRETGKNEPVDNFGAVLKIQRVFERMLMDEAFSIGSQGLSDEKSEAAKILIELLKLIEVSISDYSSNDASSIIMDSNTTENFAALRLSLFKKLKSFL